MTLDQTGGPSKQNEPTKPDPDHHPAEPAPPMPDEVGQETPNPLPDEAKPDPKREEGAERRHTEEQLDRGLEQTFPASYPVSIQSDR